MRKFVTMLTAAVTMIVAPIAAQAGTVYDDFNTNHTGGGDFNGISGTLWTETPGNTAWKRNANPSSPTGFTGYEGAAWAQSFSNGDANTGTITSASFNLDGNLLRFVTTGYGGNGDGDGAWSENGSDLGKISAMNNTWKLFRTSDDKLISQGTAAHKNGTFQETTIDVTDYEGTNVYLKLVDNVGGWGGWMGIDHIRTDTRSNTTSVFTMEIGDDQGSWTLGGSFGYFTIFSGNITERQPREGGEFIRSIDASTGTAKSPNFTITRDTLEFDSMGWGLIDHGTYGLSRIKLHLASDDSVLYTWGDDETLGGDGWAAQSMDVSAWALDDVYLVLTDGRSGSYGWVGIDDVRLTGTVLGTEVLTVIDDFNTDHTGGGDFNGISGTLWTETPGNTAWKRNANPSSPTGFTGYEGAAWAQSFSNGDANTGTITSASFNLDGNLLRMKVTGFGGNAVGPNNMIVGNSHLGNMENKWELFRTSNDELLAQGTAPFQNGFFKEYAIDVTDYVGQNVYLKLTDTAAGWAGWFGVDYIRTQSREATSISTFEVGNRGSWTFGGSHSFDYYAVLHIHSADRHPREGGEFLRSIDSGSGTATSPDFTISRATLEFDSCGWGQIDSGPADSLIKLYRASNDTVLYTWGDDETLGGDGWAAQSLDVSAWPRERVYLVLEDNVSGGYGWVGIDDVRLTGEEYPASGTVIVIR